LLALRERSFELVPELEEECIVHLSHEILRLIGIVLDPIELLGTIARSRRGSWTLRDVLRNPGALHFLLLAILGLLVLGGMDSAWQGRTHVVVGEVGAGAVAPGLARRPRTVAYRPPSQAMLERDRNR
jgi:hypothetical protein